MQMKDAQQYCIIPTETDRDTPNKLFLGGIPIESTEKELEQFFRQFGTVKDVRIVTDRVTAECKGYGFVTFDENEDLEPLLEKKFVRMHGKRIRVRRAIQRHGSQFDFLKEITPPHSGINSPSKSLSRSSSCQSLLKPVTNLAQHYDHPSCTLLTPPDSPELNRRRVTPAAPVMNTPYVMNQQTANICKPIIIPQIPMQTPEYCMQASHHQYPAVYPIYSYQQQQYQQLQYQQQQYQQPQYHYQQAYQSQHIPTYYPTSQQQYYTLPSQTYQIIA